MKLLFVTSLKEYEKTVAEILYSAGIQIFSVTKTIGFKEPSQENLLDNWFSSGEEHYDSIFIFSFTEAQKSAKAMELVNAYNEQYETGFPIRAFIVPVEQSSH